MQQIHGDTQPIGVTQPRTGLARILTVALFATAIDVAAYRLLQRTGLGQGLRTAIGFLPLPPDLVLLAMILNRVRRLDEFQKRIHFEAVVVGFLGTGAAVFAYGYLQMAGAVSSLTMPIVWAFMLLFYGAGYLLAVKRYQ